MEVAMNNLIKQFIIKDADLSPESVVAAIKLLIETGEIEADIDSVDGDLIMDIIDFYLDLSRQPKRAKNSIPVALQVLKTLASQGANVFYKGIEFDAIFEILEVTYE